MANNRTSMFLNMALVLALLLTLSMAESKRTFAGGFLKATSTPQCVTVVSVASGDICSGLQQQFDLTAEFFDSINPDPNLNCDALFVGQWLCVSGSA